MSVPVCTWLLCLDLPWSAMQTLHWSISDHHRMVLKWLNAQIWMDLVWDGNLWTLCGAHNVKSLFKGIPLFIDYYAITCWMPKTKFFTDASFPYFYFQMLFLDWPSITTCRLMRLEKVSDMNLDRRCAGSSSLAIPNPSSGHSSPMLTVR